MVTNETSFSDNYPWFDARLTYFTEINNKYLQQYRNRFTFRNLVNSSLAGIIFSRLYSGSWTAEEVIQDFSFKKHPLSYAVYLSRKYPQLNTFTGTSYAFHEFSNILRRRTKITVKKH